MQLREEGKLSLDDKISDYLPGTITEGLHVYKGKDYSNEISIKHLLSNTSGIADYFEQKQANGETIKERIINNKDISLPFEERTEIAKGMRPKFPPGKKGKAFYSDTNFQLLGKIIEIITGKSIEENYQEYIFSPLGLKKTYLYKNIEDTTPVNFYYKNSELQIPKIMASFQADGGIVSNSEETLIFLKAFFYGDLFPKKYLNEMQNWNRIFPGFFYGTGLARFKSVGVYELIGHPGASGSFAYYCPKKDTFITGTINQVHSPALAYKLIMKILRKI